jgi:hypothetical protein
MKEHNLGFVGSEKPARAGVDTPPNIENGVESITDPRVEILFRSRESEVDLGFLGESNIIW